MKIIIEGPDGAGKTELAEYLSGKFGFPIQHHTKPKTEADRVGMFTSYMLDAKQPINKIYDRFAYSELVYGPIMRDDSVLSTSQLRLLEIELLKTGAMIIFCDNALLTLWDNCMRRGESYITSVKKLQEIQDSYRHLMLETTHLIPVLQYRIPDGTNL